jgi:hypothetical protein
MADDGVAATPVGSAIRAAAVMYVALGVGFGIGAAIALDHHGRTGELPMTPWGFRALAGGPFERLSPDQFSALAWGLLGLCVLDVVAGTWLWQGRRRGAAVGLATTPLALTFGVGFALPILLAGVTLRTALTLAGLRHLR